MSVVEVSDETWGPLSVDRDPTGVNMDEWYPEVLRHQTAVEGVSAEMYLVKSNMTSLIPGIADLLST